MVDRPGDQRARSAAQGPTDVQVRRAGLVPSSAVLLVGAVVVAFVLRNVFVAAHRTIGWVIATAIVAVLIAPLVKTVERVLPRWLAVITVLLAVLTVVGSVIVGLANDLADSLDDLKASAPEAAAELERRYDWLADLGLAGRVDAFAEELDERIRHGAIEQAAATVPTYVVTGFLMLFLLASGERYFNGFVNQFGASRREELRQIGLAAARQWRHYTLVTLTYAAVSGLAVGLMCWAADLPAAVSLGFAAGVLSIVPRIGVLAGGVPALLLAFGLQGWRVGLAVAGVLVALQGIETMAVRPWLDARTVRVGPTIAIVVVLLGFDLYGVGGAAYGLALAVLVFAGLDAYGRFHGIDGVVTEP